jgi:hypothetical protein
MPLKCLPKYGNNPYNNPELPGALLAPLTATVESFMPAKPPNPVDVYVGRRLRMRRIELEMSQQTLADHIDLTFQPVRPVAGNPRRAVEIEPPTRLSKFSRRGTDSPCRSIFENSRWPSPTQHS